MSQNSLSSVPVTSTVPDAARADAEALLNRRPFYHRHGGTLIAVGFTLALLVLLLLNMR